VRERFFDRLPKLQTMNQENTGDIKIKAGDAGRNDGRRLTCSLAMQRKNIGCASGLNSVGSPSNKSKAKLKPHRSIAT